MSGDIDLTEATTAVVGVYQGAPAVSTATIRRGLEAALPIIREQIAREIETSVWDSAQDGSCPSFVNQQHWVASVNQGVAHAARIARGDS